MESKEPPADSALSASLLQDDVRTFRRSSSALRLTSYCCFLFSCLWVAEATNVTLLFKNLSGDSNFTVYQPAFWEVLVIWIMFGIACQTMSRQRIKTDNQGISRHTPFGVRHIRWREVKELRITPNSPVMVIKSERAGISFGPEYPEFWTIQKFILANVPDHVVNAGHKVEIPAQSQWFVRWVFIIAALVFVAGGASLFFPSGRSLYLTSSSWSISLSAGWFDFLYPTSGKPFSRTGCHIGSELAHSHDGPLPHFAEHSGLAVVQIPTIWPTLFAFFVAALTPPRRKAVPGHCVRCRYDLRGNVSGKCPECGTAIPARLISCDPAAKPTSQTQDPSVQRRGN